MKKIFLILLFAVTGFLSHAQDDSVRYTYSIGLGGQYTAFPGSGPMKTDFGNNYNIDAVAFTLDLSGYGIFGRLLLGGEFGGMKCKAMDDQYMATIVSQSFMYFNAGYLIVDKPGCMVYPFTGLGLVFSDMHLKNKTGADWVGPDYIIKSGENGNFYSTGGSINAGIAFRKTCKSKPYRQRLQLGLDLGIHITPSKNQWGYSSSSDQKVNVDSFGHSNNMAYYARFTIGGLLIKPSHRYRSESKIRQIYKQ